MTTNLRPSQNRPELDSGRHFETEGTFLRSLSTPVVTTEERLPRPAATDNAQSQRDRGAATRAQVAHGGLVGGLPQGPWRIREADREAVSNAAQSLKQQMDVLQRLAWRGRGLIEALASKTGKSHPASGALKNGGPHTNEKVEDLLGRLGETVRSARSAVEQARALVRKHIEKAELADALARVTSTLDAVDPSGPTSALDRADRVLGAMSLDRPPLAELRSIENTFMEVQAAAAKLASALGPKCYARTDASVELGRGP
ncbi:MAG: hypothetical protein HYV07_33650 [Deltaproteobacteria bacterium]|nr:hypothetical protein [Deltaproteobacteria bacterium]